jgi:hypothetical protein
MGWIGHLEQGYHGVGGYALLVHGLVGLQGAGERPSGIPMRAQLGELQHMKAMSLSQ